MLSGFKFHINKKFQHFQQELSAELRMMLRSNGQPFKVKYSKIDSEGITEFTEVFLNYQNDVFFKGELTNSFGSSERICPLCELSAEELYKLILSMEK